MTMYYAAVKYATTDTNERKISALKQGLDNIAVALICEFEVPLDDVREWLENAANTAEWCDQERRYKESDLDET